MEECETEKAVEINNENKNENQNDDSITKSNDTNEKEDNADESGKIVENTDDKEVDYDDEEDSADEFELITKNANDSPNKNIYSLKSVNLPSQNAYKLSRTGVDLSHPGNINGVPTVEYDLSKLVDEFKPWKKPGADITDYFNYGFTEETWLIYCEKQKNLRLSQENSALKTLSGLHSLGYPLSGSHIHLGMNRSQGMDKNKNDGSMGNKISTIPVQTGLNVGGNQPMNLLSNVGPGSNTVDLAATAAANNIIAAIGMGMLPQTAAAALLTATSNLSGGAGVPGSIPTHQPPPFWQDGAGNQINAQNMGNVQMQGFDGNRRSNSFDSMHSNEEYEDRRNFTRGDRNRHDREEYSSSRRHRSRERREKSPGRRRRSRSRERDRDYESTRHSKKRNRSRSRDGSGSRRHRHRRERESAEGGGSRRRHHRRHRKSRSRSRSRDNGADNPKVECIDQTENVQSDLNDNMTKEQSPDSSQMRIKKELIDG